ncbi:hypothetical protein [Salinigranum salinum]|uniref:hypothetical protein n=1 Tax=Salinigranum salinum TaxID=1364937 RepID=UPI0012608E06|nr:hypothetical protein [Salinigranum salinum]
MPNSDGDDVERITRPLGDVIRDVGLAVAQGQQDLDEELHKVYRREGDDGLLDWETPWYRFAEVEVDLQLQFHTLEEREDLTNQASDRARRIAEERGNVSQSTARYGLVATPAAPSGSTFSEREMGGSSRIHFRIVPVTPPATTRRDATDGDTRAQNTGTE